MKKVLQSVGLIHIMQWWIQDFPQGGAPTPKIAIIFQIFAENCMKMKEFGFEIASTEGYHTNFLTSTSSYMQKYGKLKSCTHQE